MNKIRWGILSTANIGVKKVIPAMQRGHYSRVVAIASRDLTRAQAAAKSLDIPKAYGAYEELLADPDVDAIYNPLPNHLHVPWTVKALKAGKHVLCEKPVAMTVVEARSLVRAAAKYPHLKVMEAFMYRLHPQWQHAYRLVGDGKIGRLKTVHSFFSYNNTDPENIRNIAEYGGGGMMDIGCYCVSLARFLFNAEPVRALGIVEFDPEFNIDRLVSGILDFGEGESTFTCSTQLAPYQRVNIFGEEGRIEIEVPFNPLSGHSTRLWLQRRGGQVEEIWLKPCDQYTIQGDLFSRAVLNNTPVPLPLEDAVRNMMAIEAVLKSGQTGRWKAIRR